MEVFKDQPHIAEAIKNISERQGWKDFVVVDVTSNPKGEGFSAKFFSVQIKDSTGDKQLNFAIKVAYTDDKIRNTMPLEMAFKNEIYFYSKVHPLIKKFGQERGAPESLEYAPKCFEVSVENKREMLVLENLRSIGFEMFDKKSYLDHDHLSLIFETYGRFHAYSFALRDQKPGQFEDLARNFRNLYEEFVRDANSFMKDILEECGKLVKGYLKPGDDDEVINKFLKIYGGDNMIDIFRSLVTESCRYSAILHGDCWSNNMMFKYKKVGNGKQVSDIRLIDWQSCKVGSPVCDLSYCFYSGASEKAIDNLDEYLKIYHDSFSKFLTQLGSDPEKLFSFKTLQEEWKKFAKFGMMMGFVLWKMKMSNEEEILDFTDATDANELSAAMYKASFDKNKYKSITRKILYHLCDIEAL